MNTIRKHRETAALLLILLLSAFLSIYHIGNFGYSNPFYAASVKSMLTSWKNFFFVSLDPGGWITVDKPPVSLWIQAAFAKLFGFYGWSIILPQCLAAVATVAIIYAAVKPRFGTAAGLISALTLALSPIFIAISKTNNTDSVLILFMTLSAWALLKACDRAQLRYLILSMVFLGIAYNAKTLEAFLILPALYAAYFFGTNLHWKTRFWQLALAALVLAVVSLSWSVIVDMTPANERPYVDNSTNNSELELAFGYNGIQRIIGPFHKGNSTDGDTSNSQKGSTAANHETNRTDANRAQATLHNSKNVPPALGNNAGNGPGSSSKQASATGGGGGISNGDTGILRMFNTILGGQDSWLLPFGLLSILGMLLKMRNSEKEQRRQLLCAILLWGGAVVTMFSYFSISRFFHPYYISAMAPFLAALVGIGAAELWKQYSTQSMQAYLLPSALIVTAAVQIAMLRFYPTYSKILIPLICVFSGVPALFLFGIHHKALSKKSTKLLTTISLAGLLLAPAVWTGYTVVDKNFNSSVPYAGPTAEKTSVSGQAVKNRVQPKTSIGANDRIDNDEGQQNSDFSSDASFIRFLENTNTGEKFLIAVPSAHEAEPIILATGKPVMAVGGYSGTIQSLTVEKLKQMVQDGTLKYFLVGSRKNMNSNSTDEVTRWVQEHGKEVDPSVWDFSAVTRSENTFQTLYDLSDYRNES